MRIVKKKRLRSILVVAVPVACVFLTDMLHRSFLKELRQQEVPTISGFADDLSHDLVSYCPLCHLYPLPDVTDTRGWKSGKRVVTSQCDEGDIVVFDILNGSQVYWASATRVFQHRRHSVQCLITRALASRRFPRRSVPSMRLRVYVGDSRPSNCSGTMLVSSTQRSDDEIFFPDFTFESWPETKEFGAMATAYSVIEVAESMGASEEIASENDTFRAGEFEKWINEREAKLVWRGNIPMFLSKTEEGGLLRKQLRDHLLQQPNATEMYDIEPIGYDRKDYEILPGKRKKSNVEIQSENRLTRQDHCKYRYILHQNGLAVAYSSALKWKFLCGSLIFMPQTPVFYEWWSLNMTAYKHYIPYSSPEDLHRKFLLYSSPEKHKESYLIAQAGYRLAKLSFVNLHDYTLHAIQAFGNLYDHGMAIEPFGKNEGEPPMNLSEIQQRYGPMICS